jgi:predicted phosphodiesterase
VLRRVAVSAVEDTSIQVMWAHAPAGRVEVRAGKGSVDVDHPGGPGGVVLDGLRPATDHDVDVRAGAARRRLRARTLAAPPGEALYRFATMSDLHRGSRVHGLLNTMVDRSGARAPAPVRCARGALAELQAWGADLLVLKGDLTQHGWREEWQVLGELLSPAAGRPYEPARPELAMIGVAGNHDCVNTRDVETSDGLLLAGLKADPVQVVDLPGVRLIVVDTTADHNPGTVRHHRSEVLEAAADAGRPVIVCQHHPLERWPLPLKYPMGVPWPESARFARDLARANPRAWVTAGHTHRNRRTDRHGIVHTEVGSTKDWPAVWAGYAIHEGGVRQVVRRIMAPDALGWIEYSRLAVAGIWRWYAPGMLSQRCFSHTWR